MRVTLIGTGNLGTNLCAALQKAGHEVQQLHGRTFAAEDVQSDLVIVSVKDDALLSVMSLLSQSDKLVLHTAGSIAMEVIPCKRRGVFYPMQTFSKSRIVDFREIPIFIESDSDLSLLHKLAESISDKVTELDSERRRQLHLAAVFACNFTNHCYALSADILARAGLSFDVMLPLIDETARKVHTLSPRKAQTGPAVRYDQSVISRQEAMLDGTAKDIYQLMSQSIHDSLRPKEN